MISEFGRRILPAVLVVLAAAALPSRAAPLRARRGGGGRHAPKSSPS